MHSIKYNCSLTYLVDGVVKELVTSIFASDISSCKSKLVEVKNFILADFRNSDVIATSIRPCLASNNEFDYIAEKFNKHIGALKTLLADINSVDTYLAFYNDFEGYDLVSQLSYFSFKIHYKGFICNICFTPKGAYIDDTEFLYTISENENSTGIRVYVIRDNTVYIGKLI